ncbi:MAG: hypothetical protein Q9227_006004 [Pyrenula ochraceoflavens]
MLGGLLFRLVRLAEIITLIPVIGMLAWFVNGFQNANQLTPASILTLFIVSILACAWAIATLFRMSSVRRSAIFVAFIDLCFVGAFIAADYELRSIGSANCTHADRYSFTVGLGPFGLYGNNTRAQGDGCPRDEGQEVAFGETRESEEPQRIEEAQQQQEAVLCMIFLD